MHKTSSNNGDFKNESYDIYVPFILDDSTCLNINDREEIAFGHEYMVILEKLANENHYAITCGDFATLAKANVYLNKLFASLLWFSLNSKHGISYNKEIGKVYLFDRPLSNPRYGLNDINGSYNANMTVIRPKNKKLVITEGLLPKVSIGVGKDKFMSSISQALSFPSSESLMKNKKLLLAIEIYANSNFERSQKAKFLSLMIALEVLLSDIKVPQHSKDILQESKELIKVRRDEYQKNTKEWNDLEVLLSRVNKLKIEGYKARIRKYALAVVSRNPQLGNKENISKMLGRSYDARSELLHLGDTSEEDFKESLKFLQDYVPKLLKILFEEEAGSISS